MQRLKLAYLHETYGQKIMKSDPNGLKQEIESIRNNGIEFYRSHNNTSAAECLINGIAHYPPSIDQ